MKTTLLLTILSAFLTISAFADNSFPEETFTEKDEKSTSKTAKKYKGIRFDLLPNGESYIKFGVLGQFWYMYDWNNPGTVDATGLLQATSQTMGIRRARMRIYVNHRNRLHFYTQFGTNNIIRTNGGSKPSSIFIHDFWTAYTVKKDVLNIGVGLSAWNGISRLSNGSSISKLMLDYQNFCYPNLLRTDQIGRQTGIFAYGNVVGLAYRVAVVQPFMYDKTPANSSVPNSAFEIANDNLAIKGYAAYNFLDKEYYSHSFYSMNYLGSKRILNVGAGFDIHPGSVGYYDDNAELITKTKKHFGVDLFMELPQPNGSVINLYTVGYSFDFGPNYLRSIGLMQPAMSFDQSVDVTTPQGAGVRQYFVGTGKVWYTNFGYLLPSKFTGEKIKIQPFVACNYKDFEGLSQPSWQYDAGINYFIDKHNFKISAQYSTRPVYHGPVGEAANTTLDKEKGMLMLQVQMNL